MRALADIVRFLGIVTGFAVSPLAFTFAHRALWAAAILALPAADIPRRGAAPFPYADPKAESAAPIAFISALSLFGVLAIGIGGWLGGEMVYVKGMAVEAVEKLAKKLEKPSSRRAA